ncbi:MAG: glycosyltransferase family 61 protein [Blastochloris sp.]|nr:glycosyltransferase family 61 protein [Blastochloris sp.]
MAVGVMSKRKKPLIRRIHDLYYSVSERMGIRPETAECLAGAEVVSGQDTGCCELDNSDEANLYGLKDFSVQYDWPKALVGVFHDVYVVGDQGVIYDRSGRLLRGGWADLSPTLYKPRRPIGCLAKQRKGKYLHLTGVNHENHGHFLLQHLPRLLVAERALYQKTSSAKTWVAPGHKLRQGYYLEALGWERDRLVEGSYGTVLVEELVVTQSLFGASGLVDPVHYRKLHKAFSSMGQQASSHGEVLFLSREDAPDKRLANETEIIEECRKIWPSLKVFRLSEHAPDEQRAMLAEAEWLIGPQGQAWVSPLFCTNAKCIILGFGSKNVSGWTANYRNLSLACGHRALGVMSEDGLNAEGNWVFPRIQASELLRNAYDILVSK